MLPQSHVSRLLTKVVSILKITATDSFHVTSHPYRNGHLEATSYFYVVCNAK